MQKTRKALLSAVMSVCLRQPSIGGAEGKLTVALGCASGSDFFEGETSSFAMTPYLAYDTACTHLGLDGAFYKLVHNEAVEVKVGFSPRWAPDCPDAALFTGLERDTATEAAVFGIYRLDPLRHVSLLYCDDLFAAHGGYELEFSVANKVTVSSVLSIFLSAHVTTTRT